MTATVLPFVADREDRERDSWVEYCRLTVIAQQSGRLEDARAAGRAWRRFVDLYLTADQRDKLDQSAPVVRLLRGSGDRPPPLT